MAWYYGTYNCGHEGRTNIVGPTKNRDWISEKRFSGLCPECYEKERLEKIEKENAEAIQKSKELELPELTGTEKQIAWANALRIKFLEKASDLKGNQEKIEKTTQYIIANKTKASWYIDNRDMGSFCIQKLYEDIYKEMPEEKEVIDKEIESVIRTESIVKPEECYYPVFVEIKIKENKVVALYEKNEVFRTIVKKLGYNWNGQWEKEIKETTGMSEERAAELGNHLLNAGFAISILDDVIRDNAVYGNYEPECKRWIYRRKGTNKIALNWPKGESEEIYKNARKIPTSKWDNPSVLVDISHYEEVEDFAEIYSFRFTDSAKKLINQYKAEIDSVESTRVQPVAERDETDRLEKILESAGTIINDLWDD